MRKLILISTLVFFSVVLFGYSPADAAITNMRSGNIYTTIQNAFDATDTIAGDTIRIDSGTYSENLIWPNKNNIKLEGHPSAIIDGTSSGRVLNIPYSVSASIQDVTIRDGSVNGDGGGIRADAPIGGTVRLTLINCIFTNNTITNGGGAAIFGGYDSQLYLSIHNCIFSYNVNNSSPGYGGAIHIPASGFVDVDYIFIERSVFFNNNSNNMGSAITLGNSVSTINNSLFYDNEISVNADSTIKMYNGGTLNVTNCTIADNKGIGLSTTPNTVGTLKVHNNIFYNNTVSDVSLGSSQTVDIRRNIYNKNINVSGYDGNVTFYGNIRSENPGFVSAAANNYNLSSSSIAINAGDNSLAAGDYDVSQNARIQNSTVDIGAYESSYSAQQAGSVSLKRNGATIGTYPMIQLALNAASSGDQIVLSEGTYNENINWPYITGITLMGEAEDESRYIIDGQDNGSVIFIQDVASADIKNMTIKNGRSVNGGGIYFSRNNALSAGRLNLTNSVIKDNEAERDGGGIDVSNVDLNIRDSEIRSNSAGNSSGAVSSKHEGNNKKIEGNIYLYNTIVIDNNANYYVGGVGMPSEITAENCIFEGNVVNNSSGAGGAIFSVGSARISKCIFRQNNGQTVGDALYALAGTVTIKDSLFYNNSGSYVVSLGDPLDFPEITANYTLQPVTGKIVNCTFANNNSIGIGTKGQNEIINTLFYDSESLDIESFSSPNYSLTVKNSYYENVSGNIASGSDNITSGSDPGFNNISNNDYTLKSTSSVIDEGLSTEVDNPASAVDLNGSARIVGPSVDIGAYEYQGGSPAGGSVSPSSGTGGATVIISGAGFQAGATVKFGSESATDVSVLSSTQISCKIPVLSTSGTVDIVVTNPDNSTMTVANAFSYTVAPVFTQVTPNVGSVLGGDLITITGQNFVSGMTVKLGGNYCTSVNVTSSTSLTAYTPSSSVEGEVDLILAYNNSSNTYSNKFTYETYLDTFAIIAESAKVGTSNIYIIGKTGSTYIAKDPDINLTIGITEIVSGNYAVMPLISPLVKGQRIYIKDFTNPGAANSAIVTVGTTIGPFLASGLYEGDSYAKGLGGEATNGTSFKVLKLASGSDGSKIKVVGSGSIDSNLMFNAQLVDELEDGNLLVPYISGIAGNIITVGTSRGPTIKWPQNAGSTTVEGIGTPGGEVRLYDTNGLGTLIVSANVGTDGTYSITISNTYTTQGNVLCVIGYSSSSGMGILGGIITVGVDGGPRISNTGTNQVKDGDSQVTGTGSSGKRVVIEKLSQRTVLGSGVVGTDSNFTANLNDTLDGQQKIVSVQNNISGEVITVAGTGDPAILGDYGNYPNPFDPNKESTTIEYTLNQNVNIIIHIYNISAIEIKTIECPATTNGGKSGLNKVSWDGKDGYGGGCSTGVYLYRIYDTDNGKVLGKGKIAVIRK